MRPEQLYWTVRIWLSTGLDRAKDSDRGDVPGWVMVTLMSAILVVAIIAPFKSTVLPAVTGAIQKVVSAGN